jgi:hypothetical protein
MTLPVFLSMRPHPTRSGGAAGGGSPPAGPEVTIASRVGDRGGDITLTGDGFLATIDDGTPFAVSIPAVAGDTLFLQASIQVLTAGDGAVSRFAFAVAGVEVLGTDGIVSQHADGGRHQILMNYVHVVQSGDISGGNVAVTLVAGEFGSTFIYIANDSDWGVPVMVVTNWGQ